MAAGGDAETMDATISDSAMLLFFAPSAHTTGGCRTTSLPPALTSVIGVVAVVVWVTLLL